MAPSTSSSMCCCMRGSRTKPNLQKSKEKNGITIQINGKESLTIPKVVINGIQNEPVTTQLDGGLAHRTVQHSYQTRSCPDVTTIEIGDDEFETARTHREQEIKHLSMEQLIRDVRLEEGLTARRDPTTARDHDQTTKRESRIQDELSFAEFVSGEVKRDQRSKKGNRAVFNEEGDISARTWTTHSARKGQSSPQNTHRVSVVTLSNAEVISISTPPERSLVRRYVSATPQIFVAVVAVVYTWIASFVTMFGSFFWK